MKHTIVVEKEIDIKFVYVILPVRYGTEDMAADAPRRHEDTWSAVINIETGQIEMWPDGALDFYMKVTDEGKYYLYDKDYNVIARLEDCYVPHGVIPGEYGDYVEMHIDETGKVLNWPRNPDVSKFFDN